MLLILLHCSRHHWTRMCRQIISLPNKLASFHRVIPHFTVLHCTALHWTSLHCKPHLTVLHCTALHCTEMHYMLLNSTAVHWFVLYCSENQFAGMNHSKVYYSAQYCTILKYCTTLNCSSGILSLPIRQTGKAWQNMRTVCILERLAGDWGYNEHYGGLVTNIELLGGEWHRS